MYTKSTLLQGAYTRVLSLEKSCEATVTHSVLSTETIGPTVEVDDRETTRRQGQWVLLGPG